MCYAALCTVALLGTSLVLSGLAFDYCSVPQCPPGSHVACNSSEGFGTDCPESVEIVDMAPLKSSIVAAHNEYRNRIAGGELEPFAAAARMATMRWHPELAELALLNVQTCQLQHDVCLSTSEFALPGQNIAFSIWRQDKRNIEDILLEDIGNWFDEHSDAQMEHIDSYGHPTNGTVIGHFTVMVNEAGTHIGCAAVKFDKSGTQDQSILVCNYARNNIRNRPVYESSSTPATKCSTGTNSEYSNLCSVKEVYKL